MTVQSRAVYHPSPLFVTELPRSYTCCFVFVFILHLFLWSIRFLSTRQYCAGLGSVSDSAGLSEP